MELRQIARDIRNNALVAVGTMALCLAIGVAAAFVPKPQYRANVSLLAQPAGDAVNAVAVIQFVIPQLPTMVEDPATLAAARAEVPSAERSTPVAVTASADQGTGVLVISATSPDAAAAADYANALAKRTIAMQPKTGLYQLVQLSPARPPTSPSNPKAPVLAGAAGFGVIAALFAAMGAAGLRRRSNRVAEVRDTVGTAVLAEVPRLRVDRQLGRPAGVGGDPWAVEAFQELQSSLLLLRPELPFTVAVTSPDAGAGKTTVAANLARVLATGDQRVTAIDADLRKPALHRELGVSASRGLSTWSASPLLRSVTQETTNPLLDVIASGMPDRHPAEVVSSSLPRVLEGLRAKKSLVVIDCPPVLGVAETVLIARAVNVVVVVVNGRRFRPERLAQAVSRLQGSHAEIAGVVINQARFARRRAYAYVSAVASDSSVSQLGVRGAVSRGRWRWRRATSTGAPPTGSTRRPSMPRSPRSGRVANPPTVDRHDVETRLRVASGRSEGAGRRSSQLPPDDARS